MAESAIKDIYEDDLNRTVERLELGWAGNLGRWDWDYASGKVSANRRKTEALGFGPDEEDPSVSDFTTLLHPEDYDRVMAAMRAHLKGESPSYEVEYRIRTRSGEYKWFYDRGFVVARSPEGTPLRIVGIVFDITERKKAELALLELDAAKDRLFSILAHDLRNAFTVFLGGTELLSARYRELTDEKRISLAGTLHDQSKRTYALLENLLLWARSQRGLVEYHPEPLSLKSIADEACAPYLALVDEKGVKLIISVDDGCQVLVDDNTIATAVRNLVSNALKYSVAGGSVVIEAVQSELSGRSAWELRVTDSGIGMDKDTLAGILRPAGIPSRPGTAGEKGSGLGLLLCKEFVERNGGALHAESEGGVGSVFALLLPALTAYGGSY